MVDWELVVMVAEVFGLGKGLGLIVVLEYGACPSSMYAEGLRVCVI